MTKNPMRYPSAIWVMAALFTICLSLADVKAETTCFGTPNTDPEVCSGHGICTAPDTCVCDAGYSGAACETWSCFGVAADDIGNVCSGHGDCTAPDTCTCDAGYSGVACETWSCFGVAADDTANVCSGNGTCAAPDDCFCDSGYAGANCAIQQSAISTQATQILLLDE